MKRNKSLLNQKLKSDNEKKVRTMTLIDGKGTHKPVKLPSTPPPTKFTGKNRCKISTLFYMFR